MNTGPPSPHPFRSSRAGKGAHFKKILFTVTRSACLDAPIPYIFSTEEKQNRLKRGPWRLSHNFTQSRAAKSQGWVFSLPRLARTSSVSPEHTAIRKGRTPASQPPWVGGHAECDCSLQFHGFSLKLKESVNLFLFASHSK